MFKNDHYDNIVNRIIHYDKFSSCYSDRLGWCSVNTVVPPLNAIALECTKSYNVSRFITVSRKYEKIAKTCSGIFTGADMADRPYSLSINNNTFHNKFPLDFPMGWGG